MGLNLKIKALGPIRLEKPAVLSVGKTILYGPNGAGKTHIIRALAYLLLDESSRNRVIFEIDHVKSYARLFGYADVVLCEDSKCAVLESDSVNFRVEEAVWSRRYSVARVVGNYIYSSSAGYKYIDLVHDLREILADPGVAEKVELFLYHYYTELNIERFHGDYYKEAANGRHEWRNIALLPYGIRKAIAVIYALETYDVILIEGFESALHLDLMRALLDFMNEEYKDRIIVIETHSGLPLRWGIAKGWNVYYVERNNIARLSKLEDLTNIELFRKELEALSL
jgi:energy-coupling factor transporter ATP-binding protein EcfA2